MPTEESLASYPRCDVAQLEARRSSSGGPDYYKLMEQLDRPVDQAREEDSSDGDPLAHADGIYLSRDLDLGRGIPLCRRRQGSDSGQRLRDYTRVTDLHKAEADQRAFCRGCLQRASAVFHPK